MRLFLRPIAEADLDALAAMNADPRVVEFLPAPMTRDESAAMLARIRAHADEHGFGWQAIEVPGVTAFAGFCGLTRVRFAAPFVPAVEIGWRLAHEHWGRGYATEAARLAIADGFGRLGLGEIVSFTVPENVRSRRVMEKLGMTHDAAGDFDHPLLPVGHRLRRHVLYRLARIGAER